MINSQHHPLRIIFYNAILLFCASILFQCCDVGRGCGSCLAQGDFSPTSIFWLSSGNNIYNNNTGNVGIGTTSPGEKLEVNGNIIAGNGWLGSNSTEYMLKHNLANSTTQYNLYGTSNGVLYLNSSGSMLFKSADNTKMILDNTGNVGIGTTTPQKKLDVTGGITCSDTLRVGDYTTFGVYLPGALGWVVSSSSSLKDSIRDYNISDIKKIYDLHPRIFKWKKSASTDSLKIDITKEQLGYIADEVGIATNKINKQTISLTEIVALQHLAIIDLNNRLKSLGK